MSHQVVSKERWFIQNARMQNLDSVILYAASESQQKLILSELSLLSKLEK